MPRRASLCWIFPLLLGACAGDVARENTPPPTVAPRATVVPKQQPPVDSVKSYGLKDDQALQHLLNADTALQSGDTAAAQKQLDLIDTAELTPEQRSKFQLLDAQLALSLGDAEHALQKLVNGRPALLDPSDKINYYQSLSFAHSLLGEVLPAVSARIRLGNLLQKPEDQRANIGSILDMLSVLPNDSLNADPAMNQEIGGWLELARILKQRDQGQSNIDQPLAQWRQRYPNHPANADFLQTYLQPQSATTAATNPLPTSNQAPSIAVILPASGPHAQAAKAIRAGLAAAQRLAGGSSPQLPLKFYDSEQADIAEIYQKALSEGAQRVIGPLIKEQVQQLAQRAELTVPVLALNQVDNLSKDNLYQFGLNPQDEARQLVAKARRDGWQSALILTPNNSQGQRIGNYLAAAWQAAGGTLIGSQSYDPRQHDIGAMLNALLATPVGIELARKPQAVLLSANPEAARELAPQLKYHQSTELTVYAMPNVYGGQQNPALDAELGQFSFCDMPWVIPGAYSGPLAQTNLQSAWQELPEGVGKLMALGIDAYNLAGQLEQLATTPHSGATGNLSLTEDRRISRKLVCARFKGGTPLASGPAE